MPYLLAYGWANLCIYIDYHRWKICALPVCILHKGGPISVEYVLINRSGQADIYLTCLHMA